MSLSDGFGLFQDNVMYYIPSDSSGDDLMGDALLWVGDAKGTLEALRIGLRNTDLGANPDFLAQALAGVVRHLEMTEAALTMAYRQQLGERS